MAALIAVAGVDAGADKPVAQVVSGGQGGLYIRAVVGVHITA